MDSWAYHGRNTESRKPACALLKHPIGAGRPRAWPFGRIKLLPLLITREKMRSALLILGTLAALSVSVGGACVWESHGTASSYYPFKITIDSLEARGQLNVEEKEELFFLNIVNELILVIPKEVSEPSLKFRHREEKSPGASTIQNTIELNSNNPDILLCYFINPPYEEECKTEITTNRPLIRVWPQNLAKIASSAGVINQEVAVTVLSFELDGKIDGHQFLVEGRVIYDNTEQSQLEFFEKAKGSILKRVPGKIVPLAFAILLIVPFVWMGMKQSQR